MLAKTDEADVSNQDHLVILLREELPEMLPGILSQTLENLCVHAGDPVGGLA
jgi:hypothetical protein